MNSHPMYGYIYWIYIYKFVYMYAYWNINRMLRAMPQFSVLKTGTFPKRSTNQIKIQII